ncbi:immune-responsive protein [Penicillium argentinense]|uniref:Immune-responsive protein n=1 Tax=Penicillium argentinense TaxID=1131581 RepID=A0A9W9EZT8_9EURO|nr:immune-responsive protein [Penicillium argentinense]KAJ5090910.1 immune-responsive protein [Penicillium argentinense]
MAHHFSDRSGVTKELCSWIHGLSLSNVPENVRTRVKYLILDGLCCAISGIIFHGLKTAKGVFAIEPEGQRVVWGNLAPFLLLYTEIQSFEIDDWHMLAPVHSNSIVLPALLAATGQKKTEGLATFDGTSLSLSTIVGYEGGYVGIKNVFEEPYGGFFSTIGQNYGKEPPYLTEELTKGLGQLWQSDNIRVKSHASMAGTHYAINTVASLQKEHPHKLTDLKNLISIKTKCPRLPSSMEGGRRSDRYLLGGTNAALPQEFRHDLLGRDVIWTLIDKTACFHEPELGRSTSNGSPLRWRMDARSQKHWQPPPMMLHQDWRMMRLAKFQKFTTGIIDGGRRDDIERMGLNLKSVHDISDLEELLAGRTANPIE